MRIWDINPGYLNRQSLLGEHRELHGMVSILVNGKKGYSKHPETIRWQGLIWALSQRHRQLVAEMALRGYQDRSPVAMSDNSGNWPNTYIDAPAKQIEILKAKYSEKESGRIPLPESAQEIWRHHKYSIMARNQNLYKSIGSDVARMKSKDDFSAIAAILFEQLRLKPSEGGIRNAAQHMWGYVSEIESVSNPNSWSIETLLIETGKRAMDRQIDYLIQSTALSELLSWL